MSQTLKATPEDISRRLLRRNEQLDHQLELALQLYHLAPKALELIALRRHTYNARQLADMQKTIEKQMSERGVTWEKISHPGLATLSSIFQGQLMRV